MALAVYIATHHLGAARAPKGTTNRIRLLLLRQLIFRIIWVTAIGIGEGHNGHAHVEPLGHGQGGAGEKEQHLQVANTPFGTCENKRL